MNSVGVYGATWHVLMSYRHGDIAIPTKSENNKMWRKNRCDIRDVDLILTSAQALLFHKSMPWHNAEIDWKDRQRSKIEDRGSKVKVKGLPGDIDS